MSLGVKKRFKKCVKKFVDCALGDLAGILKVHGRHGVLSYFNSLPISVLRSLDTEANKFYDRFNRFYDAALLAGCYAQHSLRPVFVYSGIGHMGHFVGVPFINKWVEFIDLPSTFRDKSVQSAVPRYFGNCW